MKDKNIISLDERLEGLVNLLKKNISIYEDDRGRAINNYETLKGQLDKIHDLDIHCTDECKLEAETNKALKLVFDSSNRLDKVIDTITKVMITQLNNESREKVADYIKDSIPKSPVNFNDLLLRQDKKELE